MKFISITPENKNASEFIPLTSEMPSFVKLYSPTCGHCVAMQEAWDELKNNPELKDYDMAIIEVHANELGNINSPAMEVNGGFPTIRKVLKNGKIGKDYNGDRSAKDMIKFIKQEFKETLKKSNMKGGKRSKRKSKSKKSKARKSKARKNKAKTRKNKAKSRK